MRRVLLAVGLLAGLTYNVRAGEIGFIEEFALASDRAATLRQLVPGTEDYYYFQALHQLNTQQFDKARQTVAAWVTRLGNSPRVTEIKTRLALLSYDQNHRATLDYLRERLKPNLDHQRQTPGAAPQLPTRLDPALLDRATLLRQALANSENLQGVSDRALEWVATQPLNPAQRRDLLKRLMRPDLPKLVSLIIEDLRSPDSEGFGALNIHGKLLLEQLEELVKQLPELLNHPKFVETYLVRLRPSADEDVQGDAATRLAYLDRQATFVRRLGPAHRSLQAHVFYQRLVEDRARGTYDRQRFLEYLRLPRPQAYVAPALLELEANRQDQVDLNADFSASTSWPKIGDDELLVRDYLAHFLVDAADTKEFSPFVEATYLQHLFAETKIVIGLGEAEQWASQLPPELFRALKERVDLDFAPTNPKHFRADDQVRLDLFVKNVPKLFVKVFEINAESLYRQQLQEIDVDLNLDGLVANHLQTYAYDDPPLRRVRRSFELPQLRAPGTYVVDFIGNGLNSRVVIRKGRLGYVAQVAPGSRRLTIVDEQGKKVDDARAWIDGREYSADQDGTISIPFSTNPGRRPLVLSRGPVATLVDYDHESEEYTLWPGMYVDRESLVAGHKVQLILSPQLKLHGRPLSIKLLEDVRLSITSTNQEGISASSDIPNVKLFEDRETTHEFVVPPRTAQLAFTLRARVKNLSQGKTNDLEARQEFTINQLDPTDKIEQLHLARFQNRGVLELVGRTGEARPDRAILVSLRHEDFTSPVRVSLKTDERGAIELGSLESIIDITAETADGLKETWHLRSDRHSYPNELHGRAGETLTLPYMGSRQQPGRDEFSLLERRGDGYLADRFDRMAIQDGLLLLRNLSPGDYKLVLKTFSHTIDIRVAQGPVVARHVVGAVRHLELPELPPLQIASIDIDAKQMRIKLANSQRFARVHVLATRYEPLFNFFLLLQYGRQVKHAVAWTGRSPSTYVTGRDIGDEYRYVLDRQQARKYPGNMLERPSLLLQPFARQSTQTDEMHAELDEMFGMELQDEAEPGSDAGQGRGYGGSAGSGPPRTNLDFLRRGSVVLVNLTPDKDGVVVVPREALGDRSSIHVFAVDPVNVTCRSRYLEEARSVFLDLRLENELAANAHFVPRKQISVLKPGQSLTIADASTSRWETYDSLARVYQLFTTLNNDPRLTEFAFVLDWPKLTPQQKREKYSKYACHELNLFLVRKDPEFFTQVVKPYLANKREKTFLDHWLLGGDLATFVQPWQHAQLNVAERALLAHRSAAERPRQQRHLADLLLLHPTPLEDFSKRFDTALLGRALEAAPQDTAPGEPMTKAFHERAPAAEEPAPQDEAKNRWEDLSFRTRSDEGREELLERQMKFRLRLRDADDDLAEGQRHLAGVIRSGKVLKDLKKADGGQLEELTKSEELREVDLKAVRALFRHLDPTQEWAENQYYNVPVGQRTADLIKMNAFWRDFVQHDESMPLLSSNFLLATSNFSEMMFALALLGLPFEAAKHEIKPAERGVTLTAKSPMIVIHEEIKPAAAPAGATPILLSQNFYRHGDRQRTENGELVDKFVTDEFLSHVVYGCQIVVTNPTSTHQKLTLLTQIPQGAMPVAGSLATRVHPLTLAPFHTKTVEFLFYFPAPGEFTQFPAHVARGETLVAAAAPVPFHVVDRPSRIDTQAWDHLSQAGANEDVLAALRTRDVRELDLEKIAFRMRDREFFAATLAVLSERRMVHPTLWSYGLLHDDPAAIREYLQHTDSLVNECGGRLKSPLLDINRVARRSYEHLEYRPLVNARAHALGARRQIVNDRLHAQYHELLRELSYQPKLDDEDWLAVTYYLLLQDRVAEAIEAMGRVNPAKVTEKLQYDYCAAYVALYQEDLAKARTIAEQHVNHPVDRWRKTFAAVIAQLDEAAGKATAVVDADQRDQQQTQLAATEPSFDFKVERGELTLQYQRLSSVRVNFYVMDVELLFSREPFAQEFRGQFAAIRPNASIEWKLPEKQSTYKAPLPESLRNKNVLVEVLGGGQTKTQPYYSHTLRLQVIENYGQLRLTRDTDGKPISKAYVKVYARMQDGTAKFYKDGYTDLRGRFDYASLSTEDLVGAQRFAILVMSDDHGATVREAAPPAR